MTENKHLDLLGKAKVSKALITLGIPTMVSLMISSLYNLVDAYFVGTLGTSQQAAVSAVYPLSLLMLGVGLFFGCGAGSYLSRLLGKEEKEKADRCASTTVVVAVVTGIILVAIMLIFLNPILRLLGCTDTMMPYAREYAIPFIIGLAINVFNCTMSNIATSEGNPLYSLRSMLFGGIANMLLDPLFILVFNMGVRGAAYATLISRMISLTCYILFIVRKKSCFTYSLRNVHFEGKMAGEIFKVGFATMIYQILCGASITILDNVASGYGDSTIAACGVVNRITSLGMMIIMGFLKEYQTFVGFNYGAKNFERVKEATKKVLIWSTVFSALFCAVMILLRTPLINAFNKKSDADFLAIGTKAMLICGITYITMGFQLVYSTKFMGEGNGLYGGLVGLGRQGFFMIPLLYILSAKFGLNGFLVAQPVADVLSTILVAVLAYKNRRKEKVLINKYLQLAIC